MKFGVIRNISGNIDALMDADRLFDNIGVDARICLGEIPGLYPFVDECVKQLTKRGYVALRTQVDNGFVAYCDGNFDFAGWSTSYLVGALKFARRNVSQASIEFLRGLPQRHLINGIAFEGLATAAPWYLYEPSAVKAAFATWEHQIVIHAAHCDPYVWHEDLTGTFLSTGRNALAPHGRLLISSGGLGSIYAGSAATKKPAAVVFDDQERSVHLLRPTCGARKIFERLRSMDYPRTELEYLERCEYRDWL